jgi:hypothetical protein
VALGANAVNGNACCNPFLDVPDHALGLGIACLVKAMSGKVNK